jgi:predicted ester cyclase
MKNSAGFPIRRVAIIGSAFTMRFEALIATLAIVSSVALAAALSPSPATAAPASTPTIAAAATDSSAANEASIRSQIDKINRGDWTGALDFYATGSKNSGQPVGRAMMSKLFEDISTTFPDYKIVILDLVAQGDSVIVRSRTSGTHKGIGKIPLNGGLLVGVPPTNKHFEVDVIHWYKMSNGKIVDHYDTRDDLAMMQQLGLTPKPKPFDWAKFATDANGQ